MSAPSPSLFVCTLPPVELRQRRRAVLARVRSQALRIEEHERGYLFHFAPSAVLEAELTDFIRFEATCCAFIDMTLRATGDELTLVMSAAPEAKPLIRAEFVDAVQETDGPSP